MNRENLEHLIRAAAEVTNEYEFVIVGSQSILGPIPNPPAELKMSMEADIYPMNAEEKADKIDGALGEGSRFHDTYGYYAQGVGSNTACLPEGWKGRLQRIQNGATNGRVGYCLEVIDLFMAKTAANREKDREFNIALLRYGYVSLDAAIDMVALMPIDDAQKKAMRARIRRWVKILEDRGYRLP
ncbi:MAG TPA: DUF6036 family nucleotidyltransferase [Ramlibacter sp.]|nr:DUF6036 family nucleotidyltransferase [Ramlibacter sp.]